MHDKTPVEFENRNIGNLSQNEEDVFARELMSEANETAVNELLTMVEESLDYFMRTTFWNAKCSIHLIVKNVAEHVMLELLRKKVFGQTLQAQKAKIFDNETPSIGFGEVALLQLFQSANWKYWPAEFRYRNGREELQGRHYGELLGQ